MENQLSKINFIHWVNMEGKKCYTPSSYELWKMYGSPKIVRTIDYYEAVIDDHKFSKKDSDLEIPEQLEGEYLPFLLFCENNNTYSVNKWIKARLPEIRKFMKTGEI